MVSAPLLAYGVRKWRAFGFGLLSATVEGVSAILGYFFLSHFMSLIPLGLAFAAGAMSYVIFAELLPDAFRGGKEKVATLSFLAGAGMAFVMASVLFI